MAETKKIEILSWRGYSTDKRIDLSGWNEGFAYPAISFKKIPYCSESYSQLSSEDFDERIHLQEDLFEYIDHSAMACIYMGVIKQVEHQWMQEQTIRATKTMIKLLQIAGQDDINGKELATLTNSLPPEKAKYLKSALATSLYFYTNQNDRNCFINILKNPLYLELGVDLLSNGVNTLLSEFQVRYMTPFPHLLTELSSGYEKTLPELFSKFSLKNETFELRRNALLNSSFDQFKLARNINDNLTKVVVDAWCYRKNSGATLEKTASSINGDYILFDELDAKQNVHEKKYRDKHLAIYNQPPLNLLDPSDDFFRTLNAERLEYYDELTWTDLLNRYLKGEVFLSSPPVTDLMNDKALSAVIPYIHQLIYGEPLQLPVMKASPFWSYEDPSKPNEKIVELAKSKKDDFVIAHRYLEGGMGIRVGKATEEDEWIKFIDTFVKDRPYLYVLRDHYQMDPDMSLRILCAASLPQFTSDCESAKFEVSDTTYARITTTSPLASDNHRSFLIFPADKAGPEPMYTVVEPENDTNTR